MGWRRLIGLAFIMAALAPSTWAKETASTDSGMVVGKVIRGKVPTPGRVVASPTSYHRGSPWIRGPGVTTSTLLFARGPLDLPSKPPANADVIAEAAKDGRFALRGLAPGYYRLRVTTADGARGAADVMIPAPGARVAQNLIVGMPVQRTLRGQLRHADGRPFRGRVIPVLNQMMFVAGSRGVKTDGEGRFALPVEANAHGDFPHGIGAITVDRSAVVWRITDWSRPFRGVVDEGVRTIEGRVVDDSTNAPVPGAEVYLASRLDGSPKRFERTTTDAKGKFQLTHIDRSAVGIYAMAKGHGQVLLPFGERGTLIARLPRAAKVRGRVVLPKGCKCPEGLVVHASIGFKDSMIPGLASVVPDPDGRFDLGSIGPCHVFVYAAGGGWLSEGVARSVRTDKRPATRELRPGDSADVVVRLVRAGRVTGRVTGADGRPIPGVVLDAHIVHGSEQPIGGRPPGTERHGPEDGFHAVSGADGRYEIRQLIPGIPYEIDASGPGLAGAISRVITAESDRPATADFRMVPERFVDVVVLGPTGKPIPGAEVTAQYPRKHSTLLGESATTDAAGRCRVGPIRAEPLRLRVDAKGHAPFEAAGPFSGGQIVLRLK